MDDDGRAGSHAGSRPVLHPGACAVGQEPPISVKLAVMLSPWENSTVIW